jgi:hypothetical protein
MNAYELEVLQLEPVSNTKDDEYSIPLDTSDIIFICREYAKLGWQIQNQIEDILDIGVEEAIKSGTVQKTSLPYIKNFLMQITRNPYFGDAASQSNDCIRLIQQYEENNNIRKISNLN